MDKRQYSKPWFVYIAECKDKTLYTGIAKDVYKRIKEHNTTNKCRYTRSRKPIALKYKKKYSNYNLARKKETEIKKFSREKKFALINSD
jgi:predicted GIY-YIG superfamily endonuclease